MAVNKNVLIILTFVREASKMHCHPAECRNLALSIMRELPDEFLNSSTCSHAVRLSALPSKKAV